MIDQYRTIPVGTRVRERWGKQYGIFPRRNGVVVKTTYHQDALVLWADGEEYWYWQNELKRERRR